LAHYAWTRLVLLAYHFLLAHHSHPGAPCLAAGRLRHRGSGCGRDEKRGHDDR
jgi:hypothetical protein